MERCESKTDRGCVREATWKQSVYAGGNVKGRVEYYSHWCDVHAESIAQKRRTNLHAEATMTRIPEEIS